jgi:hypothetical protein
METGAAVTTQSSPSSVKRRARQVTGDCEQPRLSRSLLAMFAMASIHVCWTAAKGPSRCRTAISPCNHARSSMAVYLKR